MKMCFSLLQINDTRRSDLAKFTTGQITNLISNDARRMEDFVLGVIQSSVIPIFVLVWNTVAVPSDRLAVIIWWCFTDFYHPGFLFIPQKYILQHSQTAG